MTKTEITKKITKFVVGFSVGYTVTNVLLNNVVSDTTLRKAEGVIGSMVVGYAAAEYAEHWTDRKIDEIILWWQTTVK